MDLTGEPQNPSLTLGSLDLSVLRRPQLSLLRKEWPVQHGAEGALHAPWCMFTRGHASSSTKRTLTEMALDDPTRCCYDHDPSAPALLLRDLVALLTLVEPDVIAPSERQAVLLRAAELFFISPDLSALSRQVTIRVTDAVQRGAAWSVSPAAAEALDVWGTLLGHPDLRHSDHLTAALGLDSVRSCPAPLEEVWSLPDPQCAEDLRPVLRSLLSAQGGSKILARAHALLGPDPHRLLASNTFVLEALLAAAHPADPTALVLPSSWQAPLARLGAVAGFDVAPLSPSDTPGVIETALTVYPHAPLAAALDAARALEA